MVITPELRLRFYEKSGKIRRVAFKIYSVQHTNLTAVLPYGPWVRDHFINQNNELETGGEVSFGYDANGNTVSKSLNGTVTHQYGWDVDNRLISITDGVGSDVATYSYDPFGRRLWKEVAGTKTYFLYSSEGLVGEYDATGAEIKTYGYQPNSTWTTDPIFMKVGGEYYWYLNDHLGTPRKMINSDGNVVWSATYDSFGKAYVDVENVANNLRMPGQFWDAETGLHYNWHRYYDPSLGRYLTPDPIGLWGGLNLFVYVGGNPVLYIDPTGEKCTTAKELDKLPQRIKEKIPKDIIDAIKKSCWEIPCPKMQCCVGVEIKFGDSYMICTECTFQ